MTRHTLLIAAASPLLLMNACAEDQTGGPPDIRLGDSVCAQCNMIISDERFATGTIASDERGRPEALLFDDFNCQILYEDYHPDVTILARWVHDHESREWIPAQSAHYIRAAELHTPMASCVAAFDSHADAAAMAESLNGDVLDFETLWKSTSLNAAGACHDADDKSPHPGQANHPTNGAHHEG